ncbi:MAG TPA: STT3 domain-containing protein [Candidatus Omnitrophota bacterium]|nr:STT3 domain-containing protein [Candidatus Omnitrophota bacterium]
MMQRWPKTIFCKEALFLCAGIFFVLGLNLYVRFLPAIVPQFRLQAQSAVQEQIQKRIAFCSRKAVLNLAPARRRQVIQHVAEVYSKKHQPAIREQVDRHYRFLADPYQDQRHNTYMLEIDCWQWMRYTEDVIRTGRAGGGIKNGADMDILNCAKSDTPLEWNKLLFVASAFLYTIYSAVTIVPLSVFLFYLPLFYTALFLIVLYLFCWRYWGNIAAVLACCYAGLAQVFLRRSVAGWFDTDPLNMFFPLIIVWSYLACRKAPYSLAGVGRILFAAFWVGVFAYTWHFWWFIIVIILGYEGVLFIVSTGLHLWRKTWNLSLYKRQMAVLAAYSVAAMSWVLIFCRTAPFSALADQIRLAMSLNSSSDGTLWPNTFSTVSELTSVSPAQIMGDVVGIGWIVVFLWLVLAVLYVIHVRFSSENTAQRQALGLLVVWVLCMLFASTKGMRFVMLLLTPLGIMLGWLGQKLCDYFIRRKMGLFFSVTLAILLITICSFFGQAYKNAVQILPFMNDAWYETLSYMRKATPSQAIINSWWDFGDWFESVARRRVIFDGQSQNTPQAYWMARVLLANDEKHAERILRMLNNGGNQAFEIIQKNLKDPYASIILLQKALSASREEAIRLFEKKLVPDDTLRVVHILFDKPSPAYFVVDYSMKDKIGSISFIGNWDFMRNYVSDAFVRGDSREKIVSTLGAWGVERTRALRLYGVVRDMPVSKRDAWVSERVHFISPLLSGVRHNAVILFDGGLVYDPAAQTVYAYSSGKQRYLLPRSVFVEQPTGSIVKYPMAGTTAAFSVLIFQDGGQYRAFKLDEQLAASIFVRLYYLRDSPLHYFKPVFERQASEGFVRVFQIVWGDDNS